MREIPLTQGQVALVDDADYEPLMQLNWVAQWSPCIRGFYAVTRIDRGKHRANASLHRVIAHCPAHLQVDHADHNGLNNQRSNLRRCTRSQNAINRKSEARNAASGYLGVHWSKYKPHWRAVCGNVYLGSRGTPEEAARLYDADAACRYGEFARLNFPEEHEVTLSDQSWRGDPTTTQRAIEDLYSQLIEAMTAMPTVAAIPDAAEHDEMLDRVEAREFAEWAHSHFDERTRKILQLRHEQKMTLEEAGREIGLTRERIRQLEEIAYHDVRLHLNKRTPGRRLPRPAPWDTSELRTQRRKARPFTCGNN